MISSSTAPHTTKFGSFAISDRPTFSISLQHVAILDYSLTIFLSRDVFHILGYAIEGHLSVQFVIFVPNLSHSQR